MFKASQLRILTGDPCEHDYRYQSSNCWPQMKDHVLLISFFIFLLLTLNVTRDFAQAWSSQAYIKQKIYCYDKQGPTLTEKSL